MTPEHEKLCERLREDDLFNRGPDYEPLRIPPSKLRIEAASAIESLSALASPAMQAAEPVAYMFELANARNTETNEPCNWGRPQLSFTPPCAGKYQRNVTPLYAAPLPAAGVDMVLVPREPTDEMLKAGHQQIDWCRNTQRTATYDDPSQKEVIGGKPVGTTCKEDLRDAWHAMLAASHTDAPQGGREK